MTKCDSSSHEAVTCGTDAVTVTVTVTVTVAAIKAQVLEAPQPHTAGVSCVATKTTEAW